MKRQTLVEWNDTAVRRFGTDINNWRFVCPACGKEYSVAEFVAEGGTASESYQSCIGRVNGNIETSPGKGTQNGCNWAAYGLLGTMGKGRQVVAPDGNVIDVFDFAPEHPPDL